MFPPAPSPWAGDRRDCIPAWPAGYGKNVLESGVVLSGRYRLEERVATGGMGDVWRGTDVLLGRRVALKVLLPGLLADRDFIARFRAEAQMLAALHHPGIVQVYDSGEDTLPDGGQADYLVMEYVDGEPLSQRITATGRLGVAETLSLVAQAAQALHAAHEGGIVHRDVKPSNLLVQANGRVMLLDFGVARSVNVTSITTANAVPGTALYMAPEQAAGRPVSAATDIYALGAVAYHCLSGDPPFSGDNPLQVAMKHVHDEPAALPADVPAPVAALIDRALAKDPADRYPSAEALAEAARALSAEPSVAGAGGPAFAARGDRTGATGGAGAAAIAAPGPGGATQRRGPGTLPDNPLVPLAEAGPGRPRRRAATTAGIAAVALVAASVAALVAFRPLDQTPTTDNPSPPAVTTSTPSVESTSANADDDSNGDDSPSRPDVPSSPEPTLSGTPTPDPEPDAEPSTEPTASETEPTVPAPTPSEGPNDPPTADPPVEES